MIAGWLAGKLSGILIFCVACTAPFLLIGCIVFAVQLHGISLFGWHIVDGAIHGREIAEQARDDALKDLGIAHGNITNLESGLAQCNASVDKLAANGARMVSVAQQMIDTANGLRGSLAANVAAIRGIKSTDEKCPVADTIIRQAFQ